MMCYYSKFTCSDGSFVDKDGVRYDVVCVRRVRTQEGVNVGYEPFPSLQDALEAWGLIPYV